MMQWRDIKGGDIALTLAALVALAASVAAASSIRLLLTAPTTAAGIIDNSGGALQAIGRLCYEALGRLAHYL